MLRYLLNFWLTPIFGLFFAAGAVADAGAAGGGDDISGGDSGASGGDSGGSASETSVGTDTGDTSVDDSGRSADSVDSDAQRDANALVDDGSGRKIPQKYAELFKTDKALKEVYFSAQALKREFPGGVKEAVQLKKTIEEAGGLEGIEQLRSDIELHNQDAQLFESDPAKWAEQGFTENPEAALKAFLHSLDYVGQKFPEDYDHVAAKIIVSDLDAGLPVRDLHTLLSGLKDNPQAQQLAKKLADYYNSRADISRKVPEKKVDTKLQQKEQELSKKETELRNKTINSEATPYMDRAIETSLDKAAKENGFDLAKLKTEQPNRYGRFVKDVKAAIHSSVLKDEKWLNRYSAALEQNDTAKCVRMLNARHDQAVQGNGSDAGVVRGIFQEWFGTGKPKVQPVGDKGKTPAAGARPNPGAGPLRVSGMPPKNDINWQHPKTRIIDQMAMRKDGKLVTWAN